MCPTMPSDSCGMQKYVYWPGTSKVWEELAPAEMLPESNGCAPPGNTASDLLIALDGSSVTVWTTWLVLIQVTVDPFGTVNSAGSNRFAWVMFTVKDCRPPPPLRAALDCAAQPVSSIKPAR